MEENRKVNPDEASVLSLKIVTFRIKSMLRNDSRSQAGVCAYSVKCEMGVVSTGDLAGAD